MEPTEPVPPEFALNVWWLSDLASPRQVFAVDETHVTWRYRTQSYFAKDGFAYCKSTLQDWKRFLEQSKAVPQMKDPKESPS